MLTIPVKLDLDAGAAETALKNFEKGAKDALDEIVSLDGKKINIDFKFSMSGEPIVKELTGQEAALKKTTNAYNRLSGGQAESIGRTKKVIAQFKKQRDELAVNSKEYKIAAATVRKFEERLRVLQGVQKGSTADLKVKRANLVALQANLKINSAEYNRLTAEIAKFDAVLKGNNAELDKSKKKTIGFVDVFAKIAIVSAGVQALGAALRSVGNAIDVYVQRTKDVEGFNLAIQNVGFSQAETSRIFDQAEKTAKALGAPLQQVERSYKRMIPALVGIGASAAESDKFIEAISARTQTLGLNTEQSGRLFEAFAQVLSKGKLQAEELNQQISELDGAFRTQLADALGVTTAELTEMISNSEVTADVFVKAVNSMSNGVEELKKRIREGNATISQLQNNIKTVETKNIEEIGKAIEPAIKAFLEIRSAAAEFISEFVKTPLFFNLKTVFNGIAIGTRNFVTTLLDAISAVNTIISPVVQLVNAVLDLDSASGGLVGVLTTLAVTYGVVTAAIFAYNRAVAAKMALEKNDLVMQQVAALKKAGVAALKLAPLLLVAAGALAVLNVAMKEGKAKGAEFDKNLQSVGEKLKLIGENAPGVANSFQKAFSEIGLATGQTLSAETEQVQLQMYNVQRQSASLGKAFKRLGVDTSDISSINKLAAKDFNRLYEIEQTREMGILKAIDTTKARIKLLEDEGKGNENLASRLRELLEELEKEAPIVTKNVKAMEQSTHFKGQEKKASVDLKKELEKLNRITKEITESADVSGIRARTEAIKKFGQEANAANLLAAADIGIDTAVSQKKEQAYQAELQRIKNLGEAGRALSEDEKKRVTELTKLIAQERLTQAQLGMEAQEAVNQALEDGIAKAQEFGEVSGGASQRLVGAFDGLAGSITSGLGTAMSLVDQIVAHEIQGLEKGDRLRQNIVLRQLRGQAQVNAVENTISQLKLKTQHMMETSEARILGLRLRAEAEVARSRGQTGLADALEKAAGFQGVIIQALDKQFSINTKVLDIEKRKKDFSLIQKALGENITNNQGKAARLLGVQATSLGQSERAMNEILEESKGFEDILLDSAEATQSMKEEANEFALKEGRLEAEKVRDALKSSDKLTDGLGKNIDTFKNSLDRTAQSAENMKNELRESVDFADKLSKIVAGGNPARALGGPVQGGSSYLVNDGGGREGFVSNSGKFSMLPAARNINWTAPSSGTVIPANLVGQYQKALTARPEVAPVANLQPSLKGPDKVSANLDSGSLVQRMAAVMSGNSGDQRITNHVTIQSQEPVTDASKIMTNVARMRLRKGGRF